MLLLLVWPAQSRDAGIVGDDDGMEWPERQGAGSGEKTLEQETMDPHGVVGFRCIMSGGCFGWFSFGTCVAATG
jgi:hypothetical protein